MPRDPLPVAVMMAPDPVPMSPVMWNPSAVSVVVAMDPDLATMRAGANIEGCEDG